eukprot:scaffold35553_cov73-Isochrysis_galbana.AAC.1
MAEALTFLPSMLVTAYACVSPATKKTSVARNSSSAGISGPCSTPRSRPPPAVSTRWARASSKARRTVVPLSNRMKGGVRRMPGGEATSWCLGEQRSVWCVNCGRESTRSLPPFPRPTTRGKGQRPGAGPVGVKAPCESTRCLTTTTPYPLGRGGGRSAFSLRRTGRCDEAHVESARFPDVSGSIHGDAVGAPPRLGTSRNTG